MAPVFEVLQIDLGEKLPREASETIRWQDMVDASQAIDVLFRITSTLTHDVDIQLVGHIFNQGNDDNGLVNIGSVKLLPAGSTAGQVITIKVNLHDGWHPWLGLALITTTQPTAGGITADAWVRNPLLHVS